MKKIRILSISLVILGLVSCVDSAQDTRNYIIVNDTDENVTLRFFRFESGEFTLNFTAEKEGRGIVLERFISVNQREDSSPAAALEANSVSLIFNDEKIGFNSTSSSDPTPLNINNYQQDGIDFTYRITEEIYNNAIPCDGACN